MADEKSIEDEVSEELAKQYKEEGEEVDKAVEDSRDDVEEYYEEQRLANEQKERELKAYRQGVAVDATGQPASGPEVANSAAGPVEEVAAERASEAKDEEEEKSAPKKKAPAKKKSE